jgi:TolB protein
MRGTLLSPLRCPKVAGSILLAALYGSRLASAELPYTVAYASLGWVKPNVFIADADGNSVRPLLANSDRDYSPSFSRDGSWIVFTSERAGSPDIYRVHPNGSGLERLTNDPAFDDQGALSPDGRFLAFVSTRSGRANIWLLDLGTKKLKNLTAGSSGDFRPAWSPDGQHIAFSSDRESLHQRSNFFFTPLVTAIYVMNRDGSGVHRISNSSNTTGSPAWSRNGSEVACSESASAVSTVLVAINASTHKRRVLADTPGAKWSPHWLSSGGLVYISPAGVERSQGGPGARGNFGFDRVVQSVGTADWSADEKMMVFSRETGSWPPFETRPSLDKRFQLLRTGIFPSFAPLGDRVVSNSGTGGGAHNSILVMNTDGSNRSVLFDDPMKSALAAAWSPRGARIAFALGAFVQTLPGRENLTSQLALISSDGTGLQVLPAAGDHAGYPSWSPDATKIVYVTFTGKRGLYILDLSNNYVTALHEGDDAFPSWSPLGDWIAFTGSHDGDYEIYKIHPDGTGLTQLTHSPGNDAHPKWSPDGQWIAFASNRSGFKDETGGMSDGEIYVMRADGSGTRKLTDNTFEDGTPAWAPKKRSSQAKR